MANGLKARANIRGQRIDVRYDFQAPDPRQDLRLVRRRGDLPSTVDDGLTVLTLSDLFDPSDPTGNTPWGQITRARYFIVNSLAEGGLLQAELVLFYAARDLAALASPPAPPVPMPPVTPRRAIVNVYSAPSMTTTTVAAPTAATISPSGAVLDISLSPQPQPPTIDLTAAPGGRVTIVPPSTGASGQPVPGQITWTPDGGTPVVHAGGTPIRASFDWSEVHITTGSIDPTAPTGSLSASFTTTVMANVTTTAGVVQQIPLQTRKVTYQEGTPDAAGVRTRSLVVADENPSLRTIGSFTKGLTSQVVYGYVLFTPSPTGSPSPWSTSPGMSATEMATGLYGMGDKLYRLLPEFHRYNDAPPPADPNNGQLRRLLGVLGAALDRGRSSAEALLSLHDVYNAPPSTISHLSRWIGWEPDVAQPSAAQRREILLAPRIYSTVGTVPGLQELLQHELGPQWGVQIKELFNNVFLTNGADALTTWEIWQVTTGFSGQVPPAQQVTTQSVAGAIDGRPAAAVDPSNAVWLFWQSSTPSASTPGVRQIRYKKSTDPSPEGALLSFYAASPPLPSGVDENPAVVFWAPPPPSGGTATSPVLRLFWDSNRGGQRHIWTCTVTDLVHGTTDTPAPVTSGLGEDRCPAAIVDKNGDLRLFWQSKQGSSTYIYTMRRFSSGPSAGQWEATPTRLTGVPAGATFVRDSAPAAALDGSGNLWLFFSRDFGDHSEIYFLTQTNGVWSPAPTSLAHAADPTGATLTPARDEYPTAVHMAMQGSDLLFVAWHSNRSGSWRMWTAFCATSGGQSQWAFGSTTTATGIPQLKEPCSVVVSTTPPQVIFFFRSQGGSALVRSNTFIPGTPSQTPQDRGHYVYDTRRPNTLSAGAVLDSVGRARGLYARDAVGIYLTPPPGIDVAAAIRRVQLFIEPFRPLTLRFYWFVPASAVPAGVVPAGTNPAWTPPVP